MKVIYDDDHCIVGIGETESEARMDAERTIREDIWYIHSIVSGMICVEATDALVHEINHTGSTDVYWVRLPDGRLGLPREAQRQKPPTSDHSPS